MTDGEIRQTDRTESKFFYGYVIVAIAFFVMMMSQGIYVVFGIFIDPLINEFRWTRAMISGAYSLSSVISGIMGIAMGWLSDRYGPRFVVTFSGLFLGLGYILLSRITALWQLYLSYGLIVGMGMGGSWIPLLSPIIKWFNRKRGLMTAIVVSGVTVGQFIAPLIISRMIADRGWRWSCVIIGAVTLTTIVILAQFMKREPSRASRVINNESTRLKPDSGPENKSFKLNQAVRTSQYWLVALAFFCVGFSGFAVIVHIVPHAINLGISSVTAANILAISGGIGLIGNFLLGGFLGDKIGNRKAFIIGIALMTASLFWLVPSRQVWMLYVFAIVFGIGLGGMGTSESPLLASLFGKNSHGLIYGTISLAWTIGGAVGPFIAGYMFDVLGDYKMAFLVCAVMGAAGLLLLSVIKPIKMVETQS